MRRAIRRRKSIPSSRPIAVRPHDVREVIARLVDGSEFDEFKRLYGATLVCGFAHVWGYPAGIVANMASCFPKACRKAPISSNLFATRRAAGVPAEHHRLHGWQEIKAGGIAKDGARYRWPSRRRPFPNLRLSSAAVSARAITVRAGAHTRRASCGCGRTPDRRDGRRAGRFRTRDRPSRGHRGARRQLVAGEEETFKALIREQQRDAGASLLLERKALGRRRHRPHPDAAYPRARDLLCQPQCADP